MMTANRIANLYRSLQQFREQVGPHSTTHQHAYEAIYHDMRNEALGMLGMLPDGECPAYDAYRLHREKMNHKVRAHNEKVWPKQPRIAE